MEKKTILYLYTNGTIALTVNLSLINQDDSNLVKVYFIGMLKIEEEYFILVLNFDSGIYYFVF